MATATRPYPLYCSQSDLEYYASVEGIRLRADDDNDGTVNAQEQNRIAASLIHGSDTCDFYLYAKYDPSYLATSSLVARWAVYLALYDLFGARANPEPTSLIDKAEEAQNKMEEISAGRKFLPGVPLRRQIAPVWDNTRVDVLNYQFKCIRVERGRSSQQPNARPTSPDYYELWWPEI